MKDNENQMHNGIVVREHQRIHHYLQSSPSFQLFLLAITFLHSVTCVRTLLYRAKHLLNTFSIEVIMSVQDEVSAIQS